MSNQSLFEKLKAQRDAKSGASVETPSSQSAVPSQPTEAPPTVQVQQKVEQPVEEKVVPQPQPVVSQSVQQPIISNPMKPPQIQTEKQKFDGAPVRDEEGLGIMIYGGKGESKTTLAMSVTLIPTEANPNPTLEKPNEYKVAVLCFDDQANRIKNEIFLKNPNIEVWDGTKYYTKKTDKEHLESAVTSYDFWTWLLTEGDLAQFKPDFIMLDALEVFKEVVEMKMRSEVGLAPYENEVGWKNWHKRSDQMDDIDKAMKKLAKKAIFYTSYIKLSEVKDKVTGTVTLVEPQWAGNTKRKTAVVIRVEAKTLTDGTREFFATVENSKIAKIPTRGTTSIGTVDKQGNHNIIGMKALGKF